VVVIISDALGFLSRRPRYNSTALAPALCGLLRPLPIPAPVHGRPARQGERNRPLHLIAIADPALVFAPSGLLRVAEQVWAGHVVVVPDLAPAHAGEEGLGVVRVDAIEAVSLLVVDAGYLLPAVQAVP
jgi:hypothetical protein